MEDRIQTLQALSGLTVTVRPEKGQNVYEFWQGGQVVKAYWTYPKAKAFAEGIEFARKSRT